ncbi:BTB/POZ-like protein [Colletotrichum kahawae]|uniref:BTB/POZ-like protein n=1 Tax=Colletotrichum kahawae TaxID=34407 RepID=A0AAD9Y8W5_COLKA|nr:BTB/POZ-like protein [Colletotrichum kahawae]
MADDADANMYEEKTVELHDQWDAVLVVTKDTAIRKFRVCSNVLSAASPYFKNLLVVPTFSEAIKVQNGERPNIHLEENHNQDAMEVMLSILHYRMQRKWDMVTPKELATIAMCADQYRCVEALKAQIGQWLVGQPKSNKADPDEIGYLLVALQRFEHPEEFSRTLVAAVMNVPFSFDFGSWAADPIISELEEDLRARIQKNMEKVKATLTKFLYSAITDLTFGEQVSMIHRCNTCAMANRTKLLGSCTRLDCPSKAPGQQLQCYPGERVKEFLRMLHNNSLWPPEEAIAKCTVRKLSARLRNLQKTDVHSCDAGRECELRRIMDLLEAEATTVIEGAQSGLETTAETPNDAQDV